MSNIGYVSNDERIMPYIQENGFLCDKTLLEGVRNNKFMKKITVEESQIQPASIDIRLSGEYKYISYEPTPSGNLIVDMIDSIIYKIKKKLGLIHINFNEPIEYNYKEADVYILKPHSFVLTSTKEYLMVPYDTAAFVSGRSSIGRAGLFIENAGWIDPGFEGTITLELYNATDFPIELKVGTRVGQIMYCTLNNVCENPYKGKYQNQIDVTESRIHLDKENK